MSDKIAYQPINNNGQDEEHANIRSPPRWVVPKSYRWPTEWMRVIFEAVLVAVVFFLSLKIMLDDRSSRQAGYKGPNDPKKHCAPFA